MKRYLLISLLLLLSIACGLSTPTSSPTAKSGSPTWPCSWTWTSSHPSSP